MTEPPRAPERPLRADARHNLTLIRTAARHALIERGIDVPMEEIARRAGVGIATVYRRFPDKQALIRDLCHHALNHYTALIRAARETEPGPWEALCRFLGEAIEFGAVLPTITGSIPLTEELRQHAITYDTALHDLVAAAQQAGDLRADIGAGDLPLLLLATARRLPLTDPGLESAARRRHLALLLDGLHARPDNTALPDEPVTARDVHGHLVASTTP